MNRHTGAYYTAEVNAGLMTIEARDGHDMLIVTRAEALDLLDAINAVIGAIPVNIEARQAIRSAMAKPQTAAYPGDTYRL